MKNGSAWITGTAFGAVVAAGYVICALSVYLNPDATLAFLNEWVHGIDLTAIKRHASQPIPFSGWISGLLTISAAGFAAGHVFRLGKKYVATDRK